jgi:hypothetical protein
VYAGSSICPAWSNGVTGIALTVRSRPARSGIARLLCCAASWYAKTMVQDQAPVLPPLGRSTTRSDLVAASIKSAILSGRLRPDEVLVEPRIAEQLGVSKTPVREALISLTSSGLLTPTRNRGVAVRRLRPEDVQQIYEMRQPRPGRLRDQDDRRRAAPAAPHRPRRRLR